MIEIIINYLLLFSVINEQLLSCSLYVKLVWFWLHYCFERDLAFCRRLGRYRLTSSSHESWCRVVTSRSWQIGTETA